VIIGIEPVIGLHGDDRGAKPPGIAHQGAGLDAEAFGRVARGNRAGGVRERLHDDHGLAAQGRGLLLLARRKESVEIEEQPLHRIFGRLHVHLLFYTISRPVSASASMPPRYAFRLEDLRVFHFVRASCHACGHKAIIPNATLLQGRPGYTRLMALERQLRCQKCGARGKATLDVEFRPRD
jgi:hypothetical protein